MPPACRLYLITPPLIADPAAFAATLEEALSGGDVAALQVRLKDVADDHIAAVTRAILPVAQARGVAVIMNDRPDLADALGCDGVHIGQDDASYAQARQAVGRERTVGVTCHDSYHLAMDAAEAGADYVAFGAFFPTATKAAKTRADTARKSAPAAARPAAVSTLMPPMATQGASIASCQAISSSGSHDNAMAISARWRSPPLNWKAYSSMRCSGRGMPTRRSSSMPRACASRLLTLR